MSEEAQLDLFGGATPADAVDWPPMLRELARREADLGGRLDAAEAGAIVHALEGKHDAGERCPYDGPIGREALRRLRRREAAGEQARSPRLADNSPAARARLTDPSTSHEAAAMIAPKALRDSQEAVLRLLRELGEMSDDLLVERYQAVAEEGNVSRQSPSGIRSRRSELVELGLVRDSGRKVILEPSGRRAIVWELTAAGASGWRPSRVAGAIESSFLDGPGTSVRTEAEYDPEPDL